MLIRYFYKKKGGGDLKLKTVT